MPKRVYISGAITVIDSCKQDFEYAADKLMTDGYKVVNPVFMDEVMPNADYEDYMKADMLLLDMCDAIYMLRTWKKSCGANRELGYAMAKGMEIIFEE